MKVYFYINILGGGGAERVIANLANQFSANGHDTAVITSYRVSNEYEVSAGVKRFFLEEKEPNCGFIKKNIRRVLLLRKILRKEKPDVIVSFMAEPNFRTILATRGLNIKTVLSVRNDPNREYASKKYKWLAHFLFRKADGMVFQTKDAQDCFEQTIRNKSKIIPNQVNPKFFLEASPYKKSGIYAVGRLTNQKNFLNLIDAYALIKDNIEDDLIIFGEGDLREELQNRIKELELENRVFLPGNVSDIEKKLCNAKVFVLSSDFEGMPNALMEAMAMGVACVATDCPCGGPRMLLGENDNGILVPIQNSEALALAIEKLIKDENLQMTFSKNAREKANEFSPENIYDEWEKYLLMLKGN